VPGHLHGHALLKTTWHRHDAHEESFYVLEGVWTVQIADNVFEFTAGSYVLIPCGTPHGQGNFTRRAVKLLAIVARGDFDRFYRDRAELFETKGSNKVELENGLEALRSKYIHSSTTRGYHQGMPGVTCRTSGQHAKGAVPTRPPTESATTSVEATSRAVPGLCPR
jgi:hypothetical protein